MQYIVTSKKTVKEVASRLEENIKANGFGVLHIHNLEETMQKKGVLLGEACLVYEVCNPKLAKEVLSEDMSMNMVLPCRISIYTEKGETKIGMINPSTLMKESSHATALKEVALLVEEKSKEIINLSA